MFKGICSKTLLTYTGKKQHNSMYPIVHQDEVGRQGAMLTQCGSNQDEVGRQGAMLTQCGDHHTESQLFN